MSEVVPTERFDPASLADQPEPVRRYFVHAIAPGAVLAEGARLTMTGALFGRFQLFDAHDEDTTRSAAGRAAVESFWWPPSLLPSRWVEWRAPRYAPFFQATVSDVVPRRSSRQGRG
ncbi:MAG TPA: hypothetical protein VF032_13415 [Thermoleophilaceae bacterium]